MHSAIVGIIVAALFLSIGSIYLFAKNLWTELLKTMQLPTPLWATIILVFVVLVYIYLKATKTFPLSQSSNLNYKVRYFTIGKFKWKTTIYENDYFKVEEYPFCVTHDLQFIYGDRSKYCPGTEKEKCNNNIYESDFFHIYESAKSNIDKIVRNKQY